MHNDWHPQKKPTRYANKQENMTIIRRNINQNPTELTHMLELVGKGIRTAIITVLHMFKVNRSLQVM